MLPAVGVDDPGDPRVADYVGLTDAELRRRYEGERGIFVAEGALVIRQVVAAGATVRSLLVTERRLATLHDVAAAITAPVDVATRDVLREVSGFDLHRGAVAAVDRPARREPASLLGRARRVLVLEDINDTENMGVLFRNAAGLGVDAVLLSPRCCDPLYRRTVRVSMGHVLTVPFATLEPWPDALEELRRRGFVVAALSPHGAATLDDAGIGSVGRVALLVGAEGPGLTDAALARADVTVAIPMARGVDSLNVASATAVALYAMRPRAGQEPAGAEPATFDT
ncbi:MAG TPA: RNA methyltransferase [Acidimicrobiales bacterium]|nr:RNA methyltransferase [Acidimicrobiales bacterium]